MEALRPLHSSRGILVVDNFEDRVRTESPVARPWIGFLHNVPEHPSIIATIYGEEWDIPMARIAASRTWSASEPRCLGVFVLSTRAQRFLSPLTDVPVVALRHATEFVSHVYDHHRFLRNTDKKLLLVGHWLRDFQQIFDLEAQRYRKCILRCDPAVNYERILATVKPDASVDFLPYAAPEQYDTLLGENVVFLPLMDSSANNALLECVVRNTPVLVTKLPAVVEYLGEGYPLYYETREEAARKVGDFDLVGEASAYLRAMDKRPFSREFFAHAVASSSIGRGLRKTYWLGKALGIPRARRLVFRRP